MPVRDGEPHLDEAIASISAQTLRDFEVVVVDDGSTDGTPRRLAAWAAEDPRVRVLGLPPTGIVGALEAARAAARGRYLARMDADDVAEPARFEAQLTFMDRHPGLAGCGCLVRYFPETAVRDGARRYQRWLNALVTPEEIRGAMYVECALAHPTFFLRAEAVSQVGGYLDRGWPEDWDLILRLHQAGYDLGKVPEQLHRWRERPERLSRVDPRYSPRAFRACRVHHLRLGPLAGGRETVIWGAGPVGKALSRALRRAGTPVAAFVELDPRKIGQEIHGAPVLTTVEGVRLRGPLHLAAVGQKGARKAISATLVEAGLRAGDDFVTVA